MDLERSPPRAILPSCTLSELQQLQQTGHSLLPSLPQSRTPPLDKGRARPEQGSLDKHAGRLLSRLDVLVIEVHTWQQTAKQICTNAKALMSGPESADIPLDEEGSTLRDRKHSVDHLLQLGESRFLQAGFFLSKTVMTELRRLSRDL